MQETPGIAATKSKAQLREVLLFPVGKTGVWATKATAPGTKEPSPLPSCLSRQRLGEQGPGDTPLQHKGLTVP